MGQIIAGRYELVDHLASGGTGQVWRAWDLREHEFRALKVMRQVDAAGFLRFFREKSLQVSHPHILLPLGWVGEDELVALAMPLVCGPSALTLVGDYGRLPSPVVARIMEQVLQALVALHGVGIVHRDVKPANILLQATGLGPLHALLSDFGMAIGAGDARVTRAGSFPGTPGYIDLSALPADLLAEGSAPPVSFTPETAVGQDLYALGVSMIELLNATPTSLDIPFDCEDSLAFLLRGLTDPQLRNRPQNAQEILDVLRAKVSMSTDLTPYGIEILDQLPPLDSGFTPVLLKEFGQESAGLELQGRHDNLGQIPDPADTARAADSLRAWGFGLLGAGTAVLLASLTLLLAL